MSKATLALDSFDNTQRVVLVKTNKAIAGIQVVLVLNYTYDDPTKPDIGALRAACGILGDMVGDMPGASANELWGSQPALPIQPIKMSFPGSGIYWFTRYPDNGKLAFVTAAKEPA